MACVDQVKMPEMPRFNDRRHISSRAAWNIRNRTSDVRVRMVNTIGVVEVGSSF